MARGQDRVGLSEKEETISRLYALRAGLSVIAREKETCDGIMSHAHAVRQHEIDEADMRITVAEQMVCDQQSKLSDLISEQSILERKANSPGLVIRILSVLLFAVVWALPLAVLTYAVLLICYGVGAFDAIAMENAEIKTLCGWAGTDADFFDCLIIVVVALFGAGLVGGVSFLVTTGVYDDVFNYSYATKKKATQELTTNSERQQLQRQLIRDAEEELERQKTQKPDDIASANAYVAEEQKKATEHAVAGLVMIKALEESFDDMIDPRDWENTDIIIYALETRRAENMQQALQVVDGERRTERIIDAVNTAGQEICKSINTGLSRLQSEMTRCFGILGQIVALQGDRIAAQMQGLQDGINASNSYIAQLSSQQSMSNALLAKANENSAALTAEVTRLRSNAEYAQARLLCGTN